MVNTNAVNWIDSHKDLLTDTSDSIWQFAETALNEHKSAKLLQEILKEHGFMVEEGLAGMPTAFKATWGSGKPIIGLLAEYDGLPELSQKSVPYKEAVHEGGPGHGCGHNLLGVAVLGTALGLQQEMKDEGLPGTLVFYGCPAEEIMTGKIFMARDGHFDNLDVALTWHPAFVNFVVEQSFLAMNSVKFNFYGRTSHAAAAPEQGRSALDAVELMNVGVNYLREHVDSDVRIHYVIPEGGKEPNVVPKYAQVWYYIRAPKRIVVDSVYERIVKIAQGAAQMTETRMEIEFLSGCYHPLINRTLNGLLHECMLELPLQSWNEEDLEFAKRITESFSADQKQTQLRIYNDSSLINQYLHESVMPLTSEKLLFPGSTDVADVSWITPTAQIMTCCQVIGTAGHTWQLTAASGMSIGHKGMLYAAKVLALAGSKLIRNSELLGKVRAEFDTETDGKKYKSVIPEGVKPSNPTKE